MTYLLFLLGLGLLLVGAEMLVRGASRLAVLLGMPPLVIGLTVVAYGTSTPELAISLQAALDAKPDIAVGNVVGSNISNVLLILGMSALVAPLAVHRRLIRLDVPLMIAASLLIWLLAADGRISFHDGLLLATGLAGYTWLALRLSRDERPAPEEALQETRGGALKAILVALAGLALLVLGARWMVQAAVDIARAVGVSELVIGLTIVAVGTSLPELATSVIAGIKGERDLAIGNIIGSNLYNILAILGITALVAPGGVAVAHALLVFDMPFMVATAVACLPIFFIGRRISRWEGGVFLGYYLAYTAYVILDARDHDALPAYSNVLFGFVVPITALTLLVLVCREWHLVKPRHERP